jgi:hypothetical protein
LNFTIDVIEENIDEIGSAEPDDYRCTETIKESVLRRAREDGYPKIKFRKNPQYIDRDDRIKECVMEDE